MRASRAVLRADGLLATEVLRTVHHGVASRIFALEERFRDLLVRLLTSMVLVLRRVAHHVVLVEAGEELGDWRVDAATSAGRGRVPRCHGMTILVMMLLPNTVLLTALRGRLSHARHLLLGQGLDKLRLLEEIDDLGLKHEAQLIGGSLGQPHALKQVVLVAEGKLAIRRQLQMHLCVILGDLDATVGLAFDEEERQLEFLVRVGHGPVNVQAAFLVIQKRVGDLDVSLLKLRDRDLLLDELKEELLLVAYPFAIVEDFFLALLHNSRGQGELLLGLGSSGEAIGCELLLAQMLRHWVLVRAVTSSFHLVAKSVHLVFIGGVKTEV